MKKPFWILGLISMTANISYAQAQSNSPKSIQDAPTSIEMRVKAVEERIEKLEKEVHSLSIDKSVEDPLNQTQLSSPEVLNWTKKALNEIYTYNYQNHKEVLNNIRRYFTPSGYDSYVKGLEESKNIKTVEEKKLTVSAVIDQNGEILKQGVEKDIYTWQIKVPLLVTYHNDKDTFKQNLNVTVEITRVKFSQSLQGIAINYLTAEIATPTEKPSENKGINTPTGAKPK
jgi:hypothetical protein